MVVKGPSLSGGELNGGHKPPSHSLAHSPQMSQGFIVLVKDTKKINVYLSYKQEKAAISGSFLSPTKTTLP